ncbi:MAG: YdeI/OmpD-associated family protein [Actinomycetia bacterium]|nr:YdeI/OmpD-associated family protein [Actinomycetes bacterium]
MVDRPLKHLKSRQALHDWLRENHATSAGIRLVSWRSRASGPVIDYEDVVLECLMFGWIDGHVKKLDERRRTTLLTPRRSGGTWAATNKARIERLRNEGLLEPAGERAVARAMKDGSWTLLDDVEKRVIPDDLAQALTTAKATDGFDSLSPSRQKQSLWWVKSARRPETRARRIAAVVDAASRGEWTAG